jgi:hypothetical protein
MTAAEWTEPGCDCLVPPDDPDAKGPDHGTYCWNYRTACCGASVTFHDTTLCCKGCWEEVYR